MPTRQMARIGTIALLLRGGRTLGRAAATTARGRAHPLVIAQTEDQSGDAQLGIGQRAAGRRASGDRHPRRAAGRGRGGAVADDVGRPLHPGHEPDRTPTESPTTTWMLGPRAGEQSASARVVGAEGSPVIFTAEAARASTDGGSPTAPARRRRVGAATPEPAVTRSASWRRRPASAATRSAPRRPSRRPRSPALPSGSIVQVLTEGSGDTGTRRRTSWYRSARR